MSDRENLIYVRATINLSGLAVGDQVYVDRRDPYIAALLAARYLMPVPSGEDPEG